MTFEEYTGKKVAVISNSGYIYNHDKTKKTLSEDLAAEWYGCKKEDLVFIYPYSWGQSGVYIEPADDYVDEKGEVLKRIKVTFWEIRNSQPVADVEPLQVTMLNATEPSTSSWRTTGVPRGEKYEPCFYVYSNGKVSHNDMILGQVTNFKNDWTAIPELVEAYKKAEEKYVRPSKVRTNPTPSVVGYYDYPQNMVPLNRHFTSRGDSFDESVIKLLNDVGLDQYTYHDTVYKVRSYGALVDLMKYGVFDTSRATVKKTEEFLIEPSKDMGDNIVEIEKIGKGTMIRVADDKFKETRRVFITERGTVKMMFREGEKGKKEIWYSKDTGSTTWILDALCFAKHTGKLKGEVKDLVSENPKFKYLNKWINENIDTLMGFNFAPERRKDNKWYGPKFWSYYGSTSDRNTIVEFLRTANKYPALVETLAKLGYGDLFMQTETIKYDKRDGFVPDWSTKDTYVAKKEIKSLAISRINTGWLGENLKKGSKSMLECLNINKEQWKFLTKKIDEDVAAGMSKEIAAVKNFGFLNIAEKYFVGQEEWGCFKKSNHNFVANELSEVQEAAFEKFYDTVKYMDQSKNIYKVMGRSWWNTSETKAYGEITMDCILHSYADDYNGYDWVRGDINHDTLLRVVKRCIDKDIRISDLSDYNRMRTQCATLGIEGYNIEDWPAMPKPEYVSILHDRLTELYNTAQAKRQAEKETEKQKLYDTRVDKLIKFEYENDEDDMAIVCPRKLIEIILEGQRLSHCVGSYTEAVANGVETILFLRKKDSKDKSYATIDIALNKTTKKWDIRQVHTAYNGPITEEDAEFLRKWAKSRGVNEATVTTRYGALCHLAVE